MADELTVVASLSFSSTNVSETINPGALLIDVATTTQAAGIQAIGHSTHEAIENSGAGNGGFFFFRNIDDTNFVEIGRTTTDAIGGTLRPFLKLLPGEYAIGRASEADLFAQADTATVNLQYRMFNV
jgi:hypothetical protein